LFLASLEAEIPLKGGSLPPPFKTYVTKITFNIRGLILIGAWVMNYDHDEGRLISGQLKDLFKLRYPGIHNSEIEMYNIKRTKGLIMKQPLFRTVITRHNKS